MARTKTTVAQSRGARSGVKAPRKTIVNKKIIARKTVTRDAAMKAVRRMKPGTLARREIRQQQLSVAQIIPRAPFARLVRTLTTAAGRQEFRFQAAALEALQEAAEGMVIRALSDCQVLAQHANRITIMDRDFKVYLQVVRPVWAASLATD